MDSPSAEDPALGTLTHSAGQRTSSRDGRRAEGRKGATRQAGAWLGGTSQREAHGTNPRGGRYGELLDSPTHRAV